ncbi:MAG: GGDEF domain-containing protein [Lachnospiraceae bacterium]|nr:GGDEF domain-containing protein [Lachnospiraceae bacterium]
MNTNKIIPLEKRMKDNIKNYRLNHLFVLDVLGSRLKHMAELLDVDILLTDRHGEKEVVIGDFLGFEPDVVNEPGRKIRVSGRTIGHLYIKADRVPEDRKVFTDEVLDGEVTLLSTLAEERYMRRETTFYVEEVESYYNKDEIRISDNEDILTGTLNRTYFDGRIKVLERSEIVPIAVINININDWKYANDHFGDNQSDRLIQIVASIVMEEAKPDYIVGRYDGDVFCVLVPMPEEGEAEEYCKRIQQKCDAYEDECLSPSVACGIVYKTNLEERIKDKISDAEYEMFENKFQIKNAPGYKERLTRAE